MRGLKGHYEKMRALLAERALYRSEDVGEWARRWSEAMETARRKEHLCEVDEVADAVASHVAGLEAQLALTLPVIQKMRGYETERGREDYTTTMRYRAALLTEIGRVGELVAPSGFGRAA
jgi:hypothetical protein